MKFTSQLNNFLKTFAVFFLILLWSLPLFFLKTGYSSLVHSIFLSYSFLFLCTLLFTLPTIILSRYLPKKVSLHFLVWILASLVLLLPLISFVVASTQGQNILGGSGEGLSIIFFTFYLAVRYIIFAFIVTFLGYYLLKKFPEKIKSTLGVIGIVLALCGLVWFQVSLAKMNRVIAVGCPEFRLDQQTLALGASSCINQYVGETQDKSVCDLVEGTVTREDCFLKMSDGPITFTLPALDLSFSYPSKWGKAIFEEKAGKEGKYFMVGWVSAGMNAISIGGATPDFVQKSGWGYSSTEISNFDPITCKVTRQYFKDVEERLPGTSEKCQEVQIFHSEYGDVYYYKVPDNQASESLGIKPNEGVAFIPLRGVPYKVLYMSTTFNTPEKEQEFISVLKSLKQSD